MSKMTNKLKTLHISFIYLYLIYLFISISMYAVLFAWLFPYKGPEKFFVWCLFLIIWCYYVAVLPPANRCIADRGFEYWYICPFRGTLERTVILDNLIQIFESNTQIHLKIKLAKDQLSRFKDLASLKSSKIY